MSYCYYCTIVDCAFNAALLVLQVRVLFLRRALRYMRTFYFNRRKMLQLSTIRGMHYHGRTLSEACLTPKHETFLRRLPRQSWHAKSVVPLVLRYAEQLERRLLHVAAPREQGSRVKPMTAGQV